MRNGIYLGEMIGAGRQSTSQAKIGLKQASFAPPLANESSTRSTAHYSGYAMSAGYADFPASWTLR